MPRPRTQSLYCCVEGCTNFTRARNLCATHYTTHRRRELRGVEVEFSSLAPPPAAHADPPLAEPTPWMTDAACGDVDTDVFFPIVNIGRPKAGTTSPAYDRAKAVCARCPVTSECLAYALRLEIPYGVFGGKTPRERALILIGATA